MPTVHTCLKLQGIQRAGIFSDKLMNGVRIIFPFKSTITMLQTIYLDDFDAAHIQAMQSHDCYTTVASRYTEFEDMYLTPQGIKSILNIPLMVNQDFVGFLGFDNCHEERKWTPFGN